jgi:predicted RecB family endonuclease
VQFVVRVQAGSTEYASLIALTTGTATFTMARDANNSFTMLIQKLGFNVVELGNTDGIATLQVTGVQLYDATNGLVTMSITTPQNGICQ